MPARGTGKPRSTNSLVKQAMTMAVNDTDAQGIKKMRQICIALVNKAMEGDAQAATIVFDRLEGKPAQQQIISGDPDAPLQTVSNKPLTAEDWAVRYGIAANQD